MNIFRNHTSMNREVSPLVLFLAILFLLLLASCTDRPVRIACVGDSITEGYGLESQSKSSYPVILDSLLGSGCEVLNCGRSATTISRKGDYPFWGAKEFSNVFRFKPDIITIKLGTNDTKPQNWDMQEYLQSYQAMIDTFMSLSPVPTIYLCLPVPVYQDRWGISDSIVNAGVIPAIRQIAKVNGLTVINLNKALQGYPECFPDGIHPEEKGMMLIANTISGDIKHVVGWDK